MAPAIPESIMNLMLGSFLITSLGPVAAILAGVSVLLGSPCAFLAGEARPRLRW